MDDRDRPDRRHADALAREERYREFLGKRPYTDAERDAFLDHQMREADEEADAKRVQTERCQKVYDTALAGSIAGIVGGTILAVLVSAGQWAWVHFAHLFGIK